MVEAHRNTIPKLLFGIFLLSCIATSFTLYWTYVLGNGTSVAPEIMLGLTLLHYIFWRRSKELLSPFFVYYVVVLTFLLAGFGHLQWGTFYLIVPLLYLLSGIVSLYFFSQQLVRVVLSGLIALFGLITLARIHFPAQDSIHQTTHLDLVIYLLFAFLGYWLVLTWKGNTETTILTLEKQVQDHNTSLTNQFKANYIQMQRYVSLGKISTTLLHDLANTIQYGLLVSDDVLGTATKKCLHKVSKMVRNTRESLSGSRVEKKFCINTELKDLLDFYRSTCTAHRVKLHLALDNPRYLTGDSVLFQQCIGNLLLNAFEAHLRSPDENKKKERLIEINTSNTWKSTTITISDNAGGVPEIIQSKIFEPFFSTKQGVRDQSKGIGLSMAREYLETEFNASVSLRVKAKKGSTFEIRIPRNNKTKHI